MRIIAVKMDLTQLTSAETKKIGGRIRKSSSLDDENAAFISSDEHFKRLRQTTISPFESDASSTTSSSGNDGNVVSSLPSISNPSPDEVLTEVSAQR